MIKGIGECVEIGDGISVAKARPLNVKADCLAIDSFSGGTLFVDSFVFLALAIERIAQASTDAGRDRDNTTAFGSACMLNGTRLLNELVLHIFGKEGANIPAALMFNDRDGAVGIGKKQLHG